MADYASTLGSERFVFNSLAALMAAATPLRSGDQLAGIAAETERQRVAAQFALADLPLQTFLDDLLIPYEQDEVSRLIIDRHDAQAFAPIAHLTVGGFRDWLLSHEADTESLSKVAAGITPEMAAAVSKIMSAQDLISVSRKCCNVTRFRNTQGLPGHLGTRLQPNHPVDSLPGIAAAVLDGLLFGVGDAVIGINPATDNVPNAIELLKFLDDVRQRSGAPVQNCVLTHVTNSLVMIERGAPVDLIFQSIAGTEAANRGFGVDLSILKEALDAGRSLNRGEIGNNVMYFETGQGSALSSDAHHGVDQQTLEARAYAVARAYDPLLVNTVVGFIGPEYLYNGKQIIRAGLEDVFCGKVMGLPMGCDACYTNHADADQDDIEILATLLVSAGVGFLITVPGADDIMLSYQTLSYHDAQYLKSVLNVQAAPEFESWLRDQGLTDEAGRLTSRIESSGALITELVPEMLPHDP